MKFVKTSTKGSLMNKEPGLSEEKAERPSASLPRSEAVKEVKQVAKREEESCFRKMKQIED
jgi:hypothetical protein